jgi:cytosine/adenosine deaminase-related metal-dependent hydrolase
MHIAESAAEVELLQRGTGPLAEMLREFGVWREGLFPSRWTFLDLLRELSRAPRGLVVHGNYLGSPEIDFIARHPNLNVVYCPRTHEAMGHPPHPWRQMLAAGIPVALGTDSKARTRI